MARELHPEILVIGAGPGGTAAATELARAGLDVLVVDRSEFPREKVCGDGITPTGVATLARLGVLEAVEAAGPEVIERVRIVGPRGVCFEVRFADVRPSRPHALVLPRITLDEVLRRHAVAAGARFEGGVRVERIHRTDGFVSEVTARGPSGEVSLVPGRVVVAVGGSTRLLRRSGLLDDRPVGLQTVRTYYDGARHPRDMYDFYFDLDLVPGYGWVFPAPGGLSNVGIGVPSESAEGRPPLRDLLESFVERCRLRGALEGGRRVAPVKGYPLRYDFPASTVPAGRNWVLVGEAAGLANPVTGEGIDLALESGLLAAESIVEDAAEGRDDLRPYGRALKKRYGSMFAGLRLLRAAIITPRKADRALDAMVRHPLLARTLMSVAQGIEPPSAAFHPLRMAKLLVPGQGLEAPDVSGPPEENGPL